MPETTERVDVHTRAEGELTGRSFWLPAVALVVFAALLYSPWEAIPFPVSDWGGMLAILTGEATVADQFHALTAAYVQDGRYRPALMAATAATWSAFGDNTVAWQWIRFAGMSGIILATFALARRLGAAAGAAAAAALLFVLSGMAQQSWVLMQLSEPRGTLPLVCAALLAVGYATSERWPLRAVGIVLLLAFSILYKETFIVAVPFVLALALWSREGGQWILRRPVKRDLVLVAVAIVVIGVVNVIPIMSVRQVADAQAYDARYDLGSVSIQKLRNVASALMLPVTRVAWFPANVSFLAALMVGTILGVRRHGRSAVVAVAVLLSLLVAGLVTYMPWFAMEGYYAFAFLPALMVWFALSLTWLWQSQRNLAKGLVVVTCGLLVVYGTLWSSNFVSEYQASRAVEAAGARALAGLDGRTLFVGVPSPATSGSFAVALRDYAQAHGVPNVPEGRDVACLDAAAIVMQRTSAVVVVFSTLCGAEAVPGVEPARVIRESFAIRDWKTFARSRREASARIWAREVSADGIAGR